MYKHIVKYLKGYYILQLQGGSTDRFFNICKNHGISFYSAKFDPNICVICIKACYYPMLDTYAKKCGITITVKKRSGLRYFFDKFKKIKIFIMICLMLFCLIKYAGLYIWEIDVSCHIIYTDVQLEKYIEEELVPIGTKRSEIDCDALEKLLRKEFKEIAWVSCDIDGSVLHVEFTETLQDKDIKEYQSPCNIVAVKDCVISKNIVNKGIVIAREGNEVKKGDVLISGVIDICNDYDEYISTEYISAQGYVYGIVKRDYSYEFDMRDYKKEYTGEKNSKIDIYFLGKVIKLPHPFYKNYEHGDVYSETNQLTLFSYDNLPFGIISTKSKEYELVEHTYTPDEAEKKAKLILENYINELRKKDVVILENNVKINIVDDKCISYGTIVTEELIGVPEDIILDDQGEEP